MLPLKTMRRYRPSFSEFAELAQRSKVVPVFREVVADWLTPVTVAHHFKDATYLLESVVGGERWGRYSFIGLQPEYIVRGGGDRFERQGGPRAGVESGVDPWQRLREELRGWEASVPALPGLPRFWGGAVGYLAYDVVQRFEPSVGGAARAPGIDEFCWAIGGPLLAFDNLRQTLACVVPVRVEGAGDLRSLYDRAVEQVEKHLQEALAIRSAAPSFEPPDRALKAKVDVPESSFAPGAFEAAVRKAQEYIKAGDIFQVVLSQRFRQERRGLDAFALYRAMRVVNPSPYMYLLRLPGVEIVGASPETLVRLEEGVVHVRPIAGTRPRGGSEAEDQALAADLMADAKEVAEHVMLVDLGRNDVGRISEAGSVRISEAMIVERYSHVMHIVSNVLGRLAKGCDAFDVLRATFPAGTLSGAPKVRAMQIIAELEPTPRGIYGGAVGYIGFDGNLDAAIAIRTAVLQGDDIWLQAGAGIVEASRPEVEYEETLNKAKAALVALELARTISSE